MSIERAWLVRGAYGVDAAIERAAVPLGLTVSRSADGIELRGGSQLKLRASGSLFAREDFLPRRGVVTRSAVAGEEGLERVTARFEDRLGFGVMDRFLRKKYEHVLEGALAEVEAALRGCAADVRDAAGADPGAPPSDDGRAAPRPDQPR